MTDAIFLFDSFLERAILFLNPVSVIMIFISLIMLIGFCYSYAHFSSFDSFLEVWIEEPVAQHDRELLLGLCLKTWTEQHCINKWMSHCQCTMRAEGSLWRIKEWLYGRKEALCCHQLLTKLCRIFLCLQEMEGNHCFITVSCRTIAFLIKQQQKNVIFKNLKPQDLCGP